MKQKGIFHGSLVLQTFATHFAAVCGAISVLSLSNPGNPKCALALIAIVVFTTASIVACHDPTLLSNYLFLLNAMSLSLFVSYCFPLYDTHSHDRSITLRVSCDLRVP